MRLTGVGPGRRGADRMSMNIAAATGAAADLRTAARRRLLDAAVQVIAEKGPHDADIEDFVAAAGVDRETFDACFASPEDLLQALNTRITVEMDWGLEDARNTIDDPVVLLAAIMHRVWAAFTADPIKGWVALRLEGSLAPIHPMWREQFEVLHRRAVSDGRFHLTDPRTARTLTFGAFRMAIRDLYLGQVTPDHAHHLVVMLLTAFGLSREEAIAISQSQDVSAACGAGRRATAH
jgi:AcrR family transcriptional regulator